MAKTSAGLIAFRINNGELQVLLVHPGGPFWKNKDAGAWSIPKGEYGEGEDPLTVALREFGEETGLQVTAKNFIALKPVKQKSGKWIHAWAVQQDFETAFISSNTFEMEWPPRSGRMQTFPEVDQADWFNVELAKQKLNEVQFSLITELHQHLQLNGLL